MSGTFPPPPGEPPTTTATATPPSNGGPARTSRDTPRAYDRVPPHSLEAEVSVLGAALLSRTAASEAGEILRADDFYRNAHRVVFESLLALLAVGEPIDTVTVTDWLARRDRLDEVGGAAAIHDLTVAVPTAANAAYYARIVRDKALLRRLIDAGTQVVKLGYEAPDDAPTVVDRAEGLIYEVAQSGATSDYTRLGELLNESFEQIERLAERGSEVTGLATGFDDLDRLTAGLQPQNLVIIAARPAVGKSSFCLGISQYVSVGLGEPSIVFSLEMSRLEIVNRLLSSEARIDSSRLRTGRLHDTDWRKLGDALGTLAEAPLFIDDTPSISLMEIRAKCRRLKQKHGLALVVIDYLQLMQSAHRVESRQQEVAEISRGLKMLAKELDVPVVALSQLSRQPETRTDKRPQLADLRESGCLTRTTRLFRADTGVPVTFGHLVDSGLRDVPVWASDEEGRLVSGRLTRAFPSGTKPVFHVELASGRTVEASANHPFLTKGGWRRLDQLGPGSVVATAGRLPPPAHPVVADADELCLLAHLLGAAARWSGGTVRYTSSEQGDLAAVEKAALTRFGVHARRRPAGGSRTLLELPAPADVASGEHPIVAWLDSLAVARRPELRRLPPPVYGLTDDQVRSFLQHLWAEPDDGAPGGMAAGYRVANAALARDLQLLLLRLGADARLVHRSDGGCVVEVDADHLEPTARPVVDRCWDEVVSVTAVGVQEVFDATVAQHHTFVADGLILHNSIEQDADLVGFLYRDELYDDQSPDKGIAELIISKHRNGATGVVKLAFLDHLTKFANLARGAAGGGHDTPV